MVRMRHGRHRGQSLVEFALLAACISIISIPPLMQMRRKTVDLVYNEAMSMTVPAVNDSQDNTNGAPDGPSNDGTNFPSN